MKLECCPYCKKWANSELMYKSAIRKYKRLEQVWFCNSEHAIAYKRIHQPQKSNLNRSNIRRSH